MPKLRTLAVRLVVLALLALAGDRAIAWQLSSAILRTQSRFARLYRGGLAPSVVILGDSRGVNGFYAPAIEKTLDAGVFNLSYNGMSTLVAEAVFRDYLDHNTAPRLLVLEVTNVVDNQEIIDGLSPFWCRSQNLRDIARVVSPRHLAATRVTHLLAFNSELTLRSFYYARRSDQDWINRYRIAPELVAASRTMAPAALEPRPENLAALGRIVALAKQHGIAVRPIITPYLPAFAEHFANWPGFRDEVQRTAGNNRIWDYSTADNDETHFADRLHMNDQGSDSFIARIVRDGFFRE